MSSRSVAYLWRKFWTRVVPNARYLPRSRIRTCGACNRLSLFVAIGEDEEFHLCIRCRANLRYELLARHLRISAPDLERLEVLELDPGSPLQPILSGARNYTRSFFRPGIAPGTRRKDGLVCEDITALTFGDESLDVIVSSDVLEHVPDPSAAFRESARVLRKGGVHLFTVPPRAATKRRAAIEDGRTVILIEPPEYHLDPLDPAGVLVYWDYGPDLPSAFATCALQFSIVAGPEGSSGRTVWEARKV
jgi:hypothetical protein